MANNQTFDDLRAIQSTSDAAGIAVVDAKSLAGTSQPWNSDLVTTLSASILIFTAFALVLSTVLLWRGRANGAQVLRIFGILCIVGFSAFLVIIGYSKDQLTPIVGLFGAISGYLLGKEANNNSTSAGGGGKT